MAEKSSFFNAELVGDQWDRTYTAEDYAKYFGSFIGNGVFPNPSTNLTVVSNGDMTVTLNEGKAWINGYMYYNDSKLILLVSPADGVLKRIDRLVLRLDFINREIKAHIKKGTPDSSPIAPEVTRNDDVYELSVADILVENGVISIGQSKITDTRLNTTLCGIVTQTIKEIDTEELYRKLQGFIDERGKDVDYWLNQATDTWEIEFNTWFNAIKGILDGDIAGSLANRILTLENTVNHLELTDTNVKLTDLEGLFEGDTNINQALLRNKTSILSLSKNDGNLSQLKTTDKSNLVGAINELFQNANNGKTTIANAIGTPLTPSDTFATMGTKIDTLTDTFKNNLVAKGVEVSETDKMSNLIDKISDISIGIKYGEGVGSFLSGSGGIVSNWVEHTIITNLAFTPSKIVCFMPTVNIKGSSYHAKRVAIDSDNCSDLSPMVIVGYYEAYFYIGNITQNSFSIFFRGRASGDSSPIEIRWYAYE